MKNHRPKPADVAVFKEFYDTDDQARAYAAAKLASHTAALTPEAVLFMRGAIAERKATKARADAIAAQLDKEKSDAAA